MVRTQQLIREYLDEVQKLDAEARAKKRLRTVEGFPFWPHEMVRNGIILCSFLALLFFLCAFAPYYLEHPADPAGPPPYILPDWYLLWSYGLLRPGLSDDITLNADTVLVTGKLFGIILNTVVAGAIVLVPFLSTGAPRRPVEEPFWASVGVYGIGFAITSSLYPVNLFFEKWPWLNDKVPALHEDSWIMINMPWLAKPIAAYICVFGPLAFAIMAYYALKWRKSINHYENKLSRTYYNIR